MMRISPRRLASLAALGFLSVIAGVAVVSGGGVLVIGASMFMCIALVGVLEWRRALCALLLYFPFSGIPIILLYPHTAPGALAKDFLFVLPMYIGFVADFTLREHRDILPRGVPAVPLLFFTIVVLAQILNPSIPNLVVAFIGAKVWLLYLPMIAIGYHFVRNLRDLRTLLTLMCFAGVLPALLGIVEGILEDTGHAHVVYSWYGNAASSVTQQFVNVGIGNAGAATINRVASTFSFVGQYYLFTITMVAVSYGYWRGVLTPRGRGRLGAGLFLIFVFAGLTSGARGALLFVPLQILAMVSLDRARGATRVWLPLATIAMLALAASVFGTGLAPLFRSLLSHANSEFTLNTINGFGVALKHTVFGLGSGVDTVSARYALPTLNPYSLVGGQLQESWWVKAWLELGVIGIVAVVVLLMSILRRLVRMHRLLTDGRIKAISAGMLTLLVYVLLYNFKGSFLDLDPTNVCFWLFVGVLFKLPVLDRRLATEGSLPTAARSVPFARSEVAHRDPAPLRGMLLTWPAPWRLRIIPRGP